MPNAEYFKERSDRGLERSGKLYEHFLFGDITAGKNHERYVQAIKKCVRHPYGEQGSSGYISYQEALCVAREAHRENPQRPQRKFMKDLYLRLTERVDASLLGNGVLEIYSAVGSPLDHFHGVDAFVEFRLLKNVGEPKLVTLDASLRGEEKLKDQTHRADIVVPHIDLEENPYEYDRELERIADQVFQQLLQKQ